MSRSTYTTALVGLIFGGSVLFLISSLLNNAGVQNISPISIGSALFYGALFAIQLRGWRYSAEALVVSLVIVIILAGSSNYLLVSALVVTVVAAALLPPVWSLGAYVVTFVGGLLSIGIQDGSFTTATFGRAVNFTDIVLFSMAAIGIFVAGSLASNLQQQATESARRAQEERDQVELTSRELSDANQQMNEQIAQQRQLLDLVATLETPAVQLAEGVLFTPIVGHIDTRRAQALTTRLLKEVNAQRARLVILDISGVSVMDTSVAQALLNTAKALRLLGCDVALSGISASVALTLTDLGVDLDEVQTVRSPQEALTMFAPRIGATRNGRTAFA